MTNYNDGNWHAHTGTCAPTGLHPLTKVETYSIDFSKHHLPEGEGEIFPYHKNVEDVTWGNPPYNKLIVSFRVVNEYKEPVKIWVAIRGGDVIDVSKDKYILDMYGYDDIRGFVEVEK